MNFFIAFSLAASCGAAMNSPLARPFRHAGGTFAIFSRYLTGQNWRRGKMPVLILWAVPAILVVGGGIYLIGHMH
ncbi:hypothetical protein [Bradyrhizobium sp. CCGE-LA001]|uniref:hypothetical protein n=1 Tax=Bradyrhizobium sp. CCGE-LA001 TaxID=1223566 RepID=UPI001198284A|nr:hypothetical protein [Bradyrhizobium sp. CCGE-LA001]